MRKYTGSVSTAGRAADWRDNALCALPANRGIDFFPTPGNDTGIAKAQTVCETCPIRLDCLRDALRQEGGCRPEFRHGIRGGLTADDRHRLYLRIMKARRRAGLTGRQNTPKCGTVGGYQRHNRHGEPACQACLRAKAAYMRKYKQSRPRQPAKCGTRSGYQRHLREQTAICEPCRQANRDADNRLRRTGTSKVPA